MPRWLPDGIRLTRIRDNGTVFARGPVSTSTGTLAGDVVSLVETETSLACLRRSGTLLIEHPWPKPGTKYVGSGRPKGPPSATPIRGSVTDVLRHEVLPMS